MQISVIGTTGAPEIPKKLYSYILVDYLETKYFKNYNSSCDDGDEGSSSDMEDVYSDPNKHLSLSYIAVIAFMTDIIIVCMYVYAYLCIATYVMRLAMLCPAVAVHTHIIL